MKEQLHIREVKSAEYLKYGKERGGGGLKDLTDERVKQAQGTQQRGEAAVPAHSARGQQRYRTITTRCGG